MRRGTMARIMASVITTVFIALIRTNAHPKMWQVALLTLGLYECGVMFIQIAQREARKSRRNKIIRIRQQDARRWAEEWFNPYREVS